MKLNEQQVAEMRALRPTTKLADLAARYGVSMPTACLACSGITAPGIKRGTPSRLDLMALQARYRAGETHGEIAASIGRSRQAVQQQLHLPANAGGGHLKALMRRALKLEAAFSAARQS